MRNGKIKRITAVLLALALGCTLPVGCGKEEGEEELFVFDQELNDHQVFRIQDQTCTLPQAMVFLTNYQNLYGTVYGINLWEHDFGDNSLEQYVKDLAVSQLAQIVSMDLLAEKQELTLSEEETKQVSKAAEEYYESLTKAEISYMGVKKDDILELYRMYGLANKLYAHLTIGINDEVSDDEARVMETLQIFVTEKATADEVSKRLKDGADFMTVAGTYNESGSVEQNLGKGELAKDIEEIVFALQPEEVTDCLETEDGYYFIKCVNNYNQELTDANKQVLLAKRRKEAFRDVYEEYIETLPSAMNEELWNSVEIQISDDITTRSFFEVYETHCTW